MNHICRHVDYPCPAHSWVASVVATCVVSVCICISVCGCGKPRTLTPSEDSQHSKDVPASPDVDSAQSETTAKRELLTAPGVDQQQFIGPLADAYARIDPGRDGWASESFGAAAGKLLVRFGDLIQQSSSIANSQIENVVAADFSAGSLFSRRGTKLFSDQSIVVNRVEPNSQLARGQRGAVRFRELRSEFRTRFAPLESIKLKFKVVRVDNSNSDKQTVVYFHANGPSDAGLTELTATWNVTWKGNGNDLRIKTIRIAEHENVTRVNSNETIFADCTASVLGQNSSYREQVLRGTDYWRSRLPRLFGLDVVANHGLAIGDVNGDHLDDIYVCQQGGLPNRLFIQMPDGTLTDRSSASGADWLDYCASALLVDLDNDGDRDLVVAEESLILFMENDGSGHFSLKSETKTLAQTFSISASDFDLDGDLDIFSCGYNPLADRVRTGAMGEPMPYHDAQNGGKNMLLRNESDWKFSDVADAVGLGQNNNRFSFAASWEDYDNDGDSDLYVANDYGRNNLYRNDNGKFRDVAAELAVEDMSAGMSVNWADFNRDGWMDFYVSNMFSAAGNRITFQRQFRSTEDTGVKQQYQRHARGNSLFQSDGKGGFSDVSVPAGITMGRWAWGSRFCDFNNDGWQDILVANGFITTEDTSDL